MLIGYMRISKSDGSQTLDLQKDALVSVGIDEERLYQDIASGKKESRPGLQSCLKALQPGNTLVVWKLDRLGRDLKHLVTIVDELRRRDIGFKVLTGHGAQIDTTTANGRLVFGLFATLAEYERELIIERTHAGLRAARARGRLGGCPRKMNASTIRMASAAMENPKAIAYEVAKQLSITTATLYTYINSDGSLKDAGKKLLEALS
jgi:DNA invertase Pin-like site-specific DNA recombinase